MPLTTRGIQQSSTASEAVKGLLSEACASPPDPDTYCSVTLPDRGRLNVAVGTLYTDKQCRGFALEYYALTPGVASFVHALASRGNLAIVSGIDPMVVALPLADQKEKLRSRWPQAPVVQSPSELEDWLRQNIL